MLRYVSYTEDKKVNDYNIRNYNFFIRLGGMFLILANKGARLMDRVFKNIVYISRH